MKKLLVIATIGSAIALQTAQATLITTSGNTLTFANDVTFSVNTASAGITVFVIDEALAPSSPQSRSSMSGLTFSINGGTATFLETMGNDYNNAQLNGPSDVFMYSTAIGLNIGDTVTLHAGTATSGFSPLPTTGNYNLFMTDGNGNQISGSGIDAIPEPASIALFGALAGAGLFIRRMFMI